MLEAVKAAEQQAIQALTVEQRKQLDQCKDKVITAMHRKTVELLAYCDQQVLLTDEFDHALHNIAELLSAIEELY